MARDTKQGQRVRLSGGVEVEVLADTLALAGGTVTMYLRVLGGPGTDDMVGKTYDLRYPGDNDVEVLV